MPTQGVNDRYRALLNSIGKASLNSLFPEEFEYYLVALELVDSRGNTVDYFLFPVLPTSIAHSEREITNIKKTAGGVSVFRNSSFVPKRITMTGDFGRKFKILVNKDRVSFAGFQFSVQNGNFNIAGPNKLGLQKPAFSSFAKTGFGCVKVLEGIKTKSKQLDQYGKPHRLFLYLPITGHNYIVEFTDMVHSQNTDSNNMLPKYDITFDAVAPLDRLGEANALDLVKNTGFNAIQKGLNGLVSNVRRSIRF